MSWIISENFLNVTFFAGITFTGAPLFFLHTALLSFMFISLPSQVPLVAYLGSLKRWQWRSFQGQLLLLLLHWHLIQISLPAWSLSICLLPFHLSWQIPREARRQHKRILCCLCVNWVANAQCPITNRLWKKWHNLSLITMHIHKLRSDCGLKSHQWSLNLT